MIAASRRRRLSGKSWVCGLLEKLLREGASWTGGGCCLLGQCVWCCARLQDLLQCHLTNTPPPSCGRVGQDRQQGDRLRIPGGALLKGIALWSGPALDLPESSDAVKYLHLKFLPCSVEGSRAGVSAALLVGQVFTESIHVVGTGCAGTERATRAGQSSP